MVYRGARSAAALNEPVEPIEIRPMVYRGARSGLLLTNAIADQPADNPRDSASESHRCEVQPNVLEREWIIHITVVVCSGNIGRHAQKV